MSRSLPSRPNLDHLRKQAKDLLDTAHAAHPTWQLADAQFALARGYGFSSWPAMKAHVDALNAEGPGPDATRTASASGDADCPMNGVWIANVAASIRHPAAQFQSATLEVQVNGTRITMTQVMVDAAGQPSGGSMTIDADGEPRVAEGGSASHHLLARWLDARVLEAVDLKDGAEQGRGRYEVSPDARQLVVTTGEQRLVFDRR
jgi:hypothetical protein